MGVSGQLHALAALPPEKEPTVSSLGRRLGGAQSRSGRGGEEQNSLLLPGIESQLSRTKRGHYNDLSFLRLWE
jgi:hypothetical protein